MSNKLRYYQIEDKCYPSVTTVLSAKPNYALEKWKQKMGEDKARQESERSAKRGTNVHKLIELYLLGGKITEVWTNDEEINTNELELFDQIKPNVDKIKDIQAVEDFLCSNTLNIAGTVDCIGKLQDKLSVIDFKTSSRIKQKPIENHFIQCTAYALMYEEKHNTTIDQLVLLYTSEDGTTQIFYADPQDYKQKLKDLIIYFNENEGRLIDERSVQVIKK